MVLQPQNKFQYGPNYIIDYIEIKIKLDLTRCLLIISDI